MLNSTHSAFMRSLLVALLFFVTTALYAQTTFQKSYGGTSEEYIYAVEQLSDGGYIMCGRTISNTINSSWDAYLVRLNASGDTVWTKNYGNVGYEEFQSIKPTSDGGYIVCGQTDVVDALGDVLLMKIDATGAISWSKTYGAAGTSDYGYSVRQTADGGYIIAGNTKSAGAGLFDIVLIKTTSAGAVTWSKVYGGASDDIPRCVEQTQDNGYIVAGYTTSYGSNAQMYLLKVSSTGTTTWSKTIGGSNSEVAYDVEQLSDGSYAVAGYSDSYGAGNFDMMLVKLTSAGAISWSKTYGGTAEDRALSFKITSDNGYILTGFTNSFGGGSSDYYLVKTDASGTLSWSKAFGGSLEDRAYSVFQTADGGYISTGYANSYGQGMKEVYVVKTNASGVSNCNEVSPTTTTNSPTAGNSSGVTEATGLTETGTAPTIVRRKSTIVIATQCFSAGVSCPVNASFTSSATTVCAGATVTFTNTTTGGGIGQSWEENGVLFSTATSTQRTFATAGSYIIRLISTNGTCQDTATATITVNATVTPAVNIIGGPQQPLIYPTTCGFTAVPVNGGISPTYQWFVNGISITNSNNATFMWGPTVTQQIVVQMTSNIPCASPAIVTDTIIASPINVTVTASGPTTFCSGGSVTLTANQGTSWEWNYNPNDSLQTYVVTPPANFTGTMTIYLTIMDSISGCSASNNVNPTIVTVNPNVTPSVSISANPTGPICAGTSVTFTATPTNGGTTPTYQWYNGITLIPSVTGATYTTTGLTNGDAISVRITSNAACASPTSATSNTIQITVSQNVAPSVTITANPSGPICAGTPVTFTATPVGGGTPTYTWKINSFSQPNSNSATFTSSTLTNGDVVTVDMVSSLSCASPTNATSNSIAMTVNPSVVPAVTITSNPPSPICPGTCVTFTATPTDGGTSPAYMWRINANPVGQTSDTYTTCNLVNGDMIDVVLTSNATCANPTNVNSIPVTYVVYPAPIAPTITQNGNTLSSNYATGNVWYMVGNANSVSNGQTYDITQDGDYYIVYTDANGCTITSDTINAIKIGIAENAQAAQVLVYPNPTTSNLTIETNIASAGKISFEIRNMLGQIVFATNEKTQGGLYKKNIDLALTPGIYFLLMQTNEGRITKKIEIVK